MTDDRSRIQLEAMQAAWREHGFGARAIENTKVVPDRTASGENTRLQINHLIPDPAAGAGMPAAWRVTTKREFLSRHRFHSDTIAQMRQADQPIAKGRVVYCLPAGTDSEVVAAVSFHVPKAATYPVLVTAVAICIDGTPEQTAESFIAAWIAKQYVHAIAVCLGRDSFVDTDVAPKHVPDMRYLGFRTAPRLRGFQPSATHLRQHVVD